MTPHTPWLMEIVSWQVLKVLTRHARWILSFHVDERRGMTCCTKNLHWQLSSLNPSKTAWPILNSQYMKSQAQAVNNHNKHQLKKQKATEMLVKSTQTRHDCGSTEYLPDIKSGVTLGLISGWKPPNAWMARKCLKSGARLAVMAQRAGCTAFNPWHEGLPGSVWKH